MDRESEMAMSNAGLLTPTTSVSFKCMRCGNMFTASQETCEVCGFHCTPEACKVVSASNEGY